MNSDFNLHDKIFFKGNAGIVVGLLEGGVTVILRVNDENITVVNDHPELLTLKQKENREKMKAANAARNAQAIAEAKKVTEVPVTPVAPETEPESNPVKETEPIGQVDKQTI